MEFDVKKSTGFFSNGFMQKTLFDGRLTVKQLLLILVVVVAVLIVLKLVSGVMKTVLLVVIIIFALLRFGLISPAMIKDAEKKVAAEGISAYSRYISHSDNIRASGNTIEIKVGDNWHSIDSIDSIICSNPLVGSKMSVSIDGEIYDVEDEKVVELLKSFTDGNLLHKIFGTFKD